MSLTAEKYVAEEAIRYVDVGSIPGVWPRIEAAVDAACDETITAAEVYGMLVDEEAALWVVQAPDGELVASCISSVQERAGERWLYVMTLGGADFSDWSEQLQSALVDAMRGCGCVAIRANVRRGLAKWLRRMGWRERQVSMEWRDGQ